MLYRSHKIALDLTPTQETYCYQACGVARFTWNWALFEWNQQYANGAKPNGRALKQQFNAIRHQQFPWSGEVLRDATSQPFTNLQTAFNRYFKKIARRPQFHKKGRHDSFYVANDKFSVDGRRIRLPHIGWVRMHEALRFEGKIVSATVSRTAHRWFVSIQVAMPDPPITRKNHTVVGVDLGIKHLATLSTGEKFDAPKPLVRAMKKLIRLQRQLNRKQKGSNNRNRARMRVARLYYQITCVRADALHKLTTLLVQRYSTIVLEDLNVQEMLRNNKLARAIADVGFGEFRRQVEYKASPLGASVIMADRWYPSSKLCANCGHKLEILLLSTREWACPQCGVIHDRDVNAARNLEQLGRATPEVKPVERGAMARSRGRVKLRSKKQEPTGVHQCTPER